MSIVPIRVFIADDHPLILEGLQKILSSQSDMEVIGSAGGIEITQDFLLSLRPDVVLLDFHMPDGTGLDVLKFIKNHELSTSTIVLTVADDPQTLMRCVRYGAEGYLLKDSEVQDILEAVREVKRGNAYIDKRLVKILVSGLSDQSTEKTFGSKFDELTDRELEVLSCISRGCTNRETSQKLYLGEKTVKNYASSIFKKLEVKDRVQATLYAIHNNLEEYIERKMRL